MSKCYRNSVRAVQCGICLLPLILACPSFAAWTTGAPMPTARKYLAATVIANNLYAVGGSDANGRLKTLDVYDPASNTWTTRAASPTERDGLSAVAIEGKLYAVGGWNSTGGRLNILEMYDPTANMWATYPVMPQMPTARDGLAAVEIDGKLYAVGGRNNDGSSGDLGALEVYDPISNIWLTKAPMPTARYGLAAVAIDGKLFALGGRNYTNGAIGVLEIFDPATNTWTTGAAMPTARWVLAASTISGKLYAVGSGDNPQNVLEIYDPATNSWTTGPSMPTGRSQLAAVTMNNKLFVVGGYSPTTQNPVNTLEIYDPNDLFGTISTTTWTAANSPYRVTGTITIPSGNTLTIEPGVDVLFDADVQFIVQGKLNAIGTATDSIRFIKGAASKWGGIRISGGDSSVLTYARISDAKNIAEPSPHERGGGVYVGGIGTRVTFNHCILAGNTAGYGGGLFAGDSSSVNLNNCTVSDNSVALNGGGLHSDSGAELVLHNCTISRNHAGNGRGGGLSAWRASFTLRNCIVWNDTPAEQIYAPVEGGTFSAMYCDIRGDTTWAGTGNINAEPLFVNAAAGDYRLTAGSPCIDAGDPASPLDLDGTRADMGAFAFSHQNEPPLGVIDWEIVNKIVAGDGGEIDGFGISVAASGDYVIVGAYNDNELHTGQGSAYIYRRAGESWQFVKKLVAADGLQDDYFGWRVAISGDVCVVGAMYDDETYSNQGSAYIFGQNVGGPDNWGLVKKLVAADGLQDDAFGWSVAISGETCIVGASYDDETYSNQGSAYVFDRNVGGVDSWGLVRKLLGPNAQTHDLFGYVVSISGDVCVVGVHEYSGTYADQGAAYVYERNIGGPNNWGLVKELVAPDAQAGDIFGYSVSISGDACVIVALGDDETYMDQGSAYIFGRDVGGTDNWGLVRKLVVPDGTESKEFGRSVAIAGDVCVVGENYADGLHYGSEYVYGRNTGGADNWGFDRRLYAADGTTGDRYGYAVALTSDLCVVGAYADDESYANQGSVYIYGTAGTSGGSYFALIAPVVEVTPGETVVVPIMATTGTAISSADLVFRIDTTVVRPDPVAFVRSTPFPENAEIEWSIAGDVVRVSFAVGLNDAYDFANVPIVDLAFVTNPGISGTSPIAWLPYPETSMDEQPAALTDGRIVVRSIQYGDVNDDGDITAYDASLILKHVVRTISVSIDSVRADVTGNGRITSFDASHVLTRVVDASHVFPVELGGLAKPAPFVPPALSWLRDGGGWALVASDATGIEAGDLVFRLPDAGEARMSIDGPSASNQTGDILRVAFVRPLGAKGTVLLRLDGVAEAPEVVEALLNEVPVTARPVSLSLSQNAPNPFNPETIIRYGLPATGHVELAIYDVTGRLVRMLVSDEMIAGAHEVVWNATDGAGRSVASGVYVYRLTSAQGTVVRRMTLVR